MSNINIDLALVREVASECDRNVPDTNLQLPSVEFCIADVGTYSNDTEYRFGKVIIRELVKNEKTGQNVFPMGGLFTSSHERNGVVLVTGCGDVCNGLCVAERILLLKISASGSVNFHKVRYHHIWR